jgi:Uma2 family endonuclease
MEPHRRPLVSEDEFLAMPETTEKVELIDGELVVSPSPSYWHQEILARIVMALRGWASRAGQPVTVGMAPLDVRFARGRILQPDAFVILGPVAADHVGSIARVPEPCVEVLSTDRVHDRVTKRLLYAAAACASTGSSSRPA